MSNLLALTLALGLQAQADADRIVCVPNADLSGWDCGKGADAPAARPLPRQPRSEPASSPPPYLIDPARLPAVMGASEYEAAPAPVAAEPALAAPEPAAESREEPVTPSPAQATADVDSSVPAATPQTPEAEASPPAAPPAAVAPAPVTAAAPAPEPAPSPPAAAESQVTSPAPRMQAPVADSPPPEANTRPTRSISSVARDAADLLALPPTGYTVQLVASRSFAGYAEFRQRLGLAVEDTFVIRVRRGNQDWWLLLWRDFPDLASARAAAATLKGSYWPRRLAPLQAEVQATPD